MWYGKNDDDFVSRVDEGESPNDRIAELETELTRVERERDEARAALNAIKLILKNS
jgi:hypothetical protein